MRSAEAPVLGPARRRPSCDVRSSTAGARHRRAAVHGRPAARSHLRARQTTGCCPTSAASSSGRRRVAQRLRRQRQASSTSWSRPAAVAGNRAWHAYESSTARRAGRAARRRAPASGLASQRISAQHRARTAPRAPQQTMVKQVRAIAGPRGTHVLVGGDDRHTDRRQARDQLTAAARRRHHRHHHVHLAVPVHRQHRAAGAGFARQRAHSRGDARRDGVDLPGRPLLDAARLHADTHQHLDAGAAVLHRLRTCRWTTRSS